MKTPTLAPVYLDNEPVSLMGDPRPQVSKVVAATGKHPEKFDVMLLRSETDTEGKVLELDYVIDRTEEPTKAIYLTTVEKDSGTDTIGAEGAEDISTQAGSKFGTPAKGEGASHTGQGSGSSGGAYGFGSKSGPGMSTSTKSVGSGGSIEQGKQAQGGSAQGNQGFGSGSGRTENQGTSTQNQGAGSSNQGSFGRSSGIQQPGKTGGQEPRGGVGTSSQTNQGKTQNLGSGQGFGKTANKPGTTGQSGSGSEEEAGDDWPVQGGQSKSTSKSTSDEDVE